MQTLENTHAQFEYGVILKGSKTGELDSNKWISFEYGVILKGSKTLETAELGFF